MGLASVELDRIAEIDDGAVDARAHEAFAAEALELELQLPLPRSRDRREDAEARALRQSEDAVDDLLDRLGLDPLPAARAVRDADASEEQAQVVGDLGDRADGRARRLRQWALLDRDRGREPFDAVDVGLRELLEELARVSGEGLDVAPLTLGVDCVERERRLP